MIRPMVWERDKKQLWGKVWFLKKPLAGDARSYHGCDDDDDGCDCDDGIDDGCDDYEDFVDGCDYDDSYDDGGDDDDTAVDD